MEPAGGFRKGSSSTGTAAWGAVVIDGDWLVGSVPPFREGINRARARRETEELVATSFPGGSCFSPRLLLVPALSSPAMLGAAARPRRLRNAYPVPARHDGRPRHEGASPRPLPTGSSHDVVVRGVRLASDTVVQDKPVC